MIRGLSFTQSRSIIISGFLALTILSGGYGCAPLPPTAEPPPPTPCSIDSSKVNIYRTEPTSWANAIFTYAYPYAALPTPIPPATAIPVQLNEQQILEARYAAFQYLINETKRWSDTTTIKLDDTNEAHLTITFINPTLLQAVYLNQVLKHRFFISDFQTQLKNVLDSIAARDELLFLFTVTTTNNGNANSTPHILNIPVSKMYLNNSENLQVSPNHDDHNIEQPINTSLDPIFGYIAYPFTTLSNNNCKWVLDPKYNTNIVITVPNILIDGSVSTPHTWTIPYTSLITADIPSDPPTFIIPAGYETNLMSALVMPPNPITNPNGTAPEAYWRDFARYVWNQITLGNY